MPSKGSRLGQLAVWLSRGADLVDSYRLRCQTGRPRLGRVQSKHQYLPLAREPDEPAQLAR